MWPTKLNEWVTVIVLAPFALFSGIWGLVQLYKLVTAPTPRLVATVEYGRYSHFTNGG